MYRWQPESQTWRQLMFTLPPEDYNLVGIGGVALDPNNTDVIYAMAGMFVERSPQDILKSEDRGETWTRLGFNKVIGANHKYTRVTGERIVVDPNNSNRVWVGTLNDGLWLSEDAGKTWRQNRAISEWTNEYGINLITFDQNTGTDKDGNSTDMYVSVWDDGLYKSSDAGKTFNKVEGAPRYISRVQWSGGKMYFSSWAETADEIGLGYYKNGKIIDLTPEYYIQNANQTSYGFSGLMIDRTNPDFIMAIGSPWSGNADYLYRTKNGGKDWEIVKLGHVQGGCSCLVQDPDDPKVVWNTNGTGVSVFTNIYEDIVDMKMSYKPHQKGMEEMVVLKTLSIPHKDAPLLLIPDYDRGYSFVEDPYQTAVLAHDGHGQAGMVNSMDFCEEAPNFVVRTGRQADSTSHMALSTQYGRFGIVNNYWDSSKIAVACTISSTVRENGYPMIMVTTAKYNGVSGSLYRSYDWGVTWEKLEGIETNLTNAKWSQYQNYILTGDRVDSKTFYYSEDGKFYMTTDDGTTWNMTKDFGGVTHIWAVPGYEGMVYAVSGGNLYKTVDKGYTWETITTIQSAYRISFGKGKETSAYPALYMNGTINNQRGLYISDDMGLSWRRIDDDAVNPWVYEDDRCITGDRKTYGRVFVTAGASGVVYFQLTGLDDIRPLLTVDNKGTSDENPLNKAVINNKIMITGKTDEKAEVRINNIPVNVNDDYSFKHEIELTEGINSVRVEAVDKNMNKAYPVYLTYRYDPGYMGIQIDGSESVITNKNTQIVSGATAEPARISVNGIEGITDEDNKFSIECPITVDTKEIMVTAVSLTGAEKVLKLSQ